MDKRTATYHVTFLTVHEAKAETFEIATTDFMTAVQVVNARLSQRFMEYKILEVRKRACLNWDMQEQADKALDKVILGD